MLAIPHTRDIELAGKRLVNPAIYLLDVTVGNLRNVLVIRNIAEEVAGIGIAREVERSGE